MPFPTSQSPLADTTGALAALGNQGSVFFLAGTGNGQPVVRSVTVAANQYLFFPVVNSVTWEAISAYGGSEAGLRRDAAETIGINALGEVSNAALFAMLNGINLALPSPTTSLFDFRQVSPPGVFNIDVPADNIFGVAGGNVAATSDGWWLMLSPFAPGNYTLRFGGSTRGIGPYQDFTISQDNTYNITVGAVPEPSTLLLGSAVLALTMLRRVRVLR